MPFDIAAFDFHPSEAPETKTPAKPDVFSLDGFIAFCRTMPADEIYNPITTERCALGQYAASLGGRRDHRNRCYVIGQTKFHERGTALEHISISAEPYTFGAALTRALALKNSKGG